MSGPIKRHEIPSATWIGTGGDFVVNNSDGKIFQHYVDLIDKAIKIGKTPIRVDISTAYFTISGWKSIYNGLEKVEKVRLLLGVEPSVISSLEDSSFHNSHNNGISQKEMEELLDNQVAALKKARDLMGFSKESEQNILMFCAAIRDGLESGNFEVRIYRKGFLHGKTLIVKHKDSPLYLSTGSANLTASGLSKNIEAAITTKAAPLITKGINWFNEIWEESESFSQELLDIYESRVIPYEPRLIYLRMLYEAFGEDNLFDLGKKEEINELLDEVWLDKLVDFQRDGVLRAQHILDKYGGVLISDEVGLGKTYIGGALLKKVVFEGGKKALILTPRSIYETVWMEYVKDNKLNNKVSVYSYGEAYRKLVEGNGVDPSDYSLILIDEAHNYRNNGTKRREDLLNIISSTNNAQKILLTATPITNKMSDMYNLLSLFAYDDILSDIGIPSMKEKFEEADKGTVSNQDWTWIWHLLDKVTLRRTRNFVIENYSKDNVLKGPEDTVWTFPFLKAPIPQEYSLSQEAKDLMAEVFGALTKGYDDAPKENSSGAVLYLAAYHSSKYRKSWEKQTGKNTKRTAHIQQNNQGLIRTSLLKSFESSPAAFFYFCVTLYDETKRWYDAIKEKKESIDETLISDFLIEGDNPEKEEGEDYMYLSGSSTREAQKIQISNLDILRFEKELENDLRLLERWKDISEELMKKGEKDPKIVVLIDLLAKIAEEAKKESEESGMAEGDLRKLVIFASSAKTVEWLKDNFEDAFAEACKKYPQLEAYYRCKRDTNNVSKDESCPLAIYITGSDASVDREKKLALFAPRSYLKSTEVKDKCDILITTDVLSEGVNLQQAGKICHIDLPWTVTRIIQRIGRIDRLKSDHKHIYNYMFMPDKDLDEYLAIMERLRKKGAFATYSYGEKQVVANSSSELENSGVSDYVGDISGEDLKEIKRIQDKKSEIFKKKKEKMPDTETLRFWLSEELNNPETTSSILNLPTGSGSVFRSWHENQEGIVFCAKIHHPSIEGDSPAVFRTVRELPIKNSEYRTETWDALMTGNPANPAEDSLPKYAEIVSPNKDEAEKLFSAWEKALKDIVTVWNKESELEKHKLEEEKTGVIFDRMNEQNISNKLNKLSQPKIEYVIKVLGSSLQDFHRKKIKKLLDSENPEEVYNYIIKQRIRVHKKQPKPLITADNVELVVWLMVLPKSAKKIVEDVLPKEAHDRKGIIDSDIQLVSTDIPFVEANFNDEDQEQYSSVRTWVALALQVMPIKSEPLHTKKILKLIQDQGLDTKAGLYGETPDQTLGRDLNIESSKSFPRIEKAGPALWVRLK